MTSSPFFDNVCTLPVLTDLFAQALHPTKPILITGLATGHVHAYRLPSAKEESSPPPQALENGAKSILSLRRRSSTASENGLGSIETLWKTRRHKGSCRALAYSPDGNTCYSGGTDGLVKAFESMTGRVTSKIAIPIPEGYKEAIDAPTTIHALTPLHLIVTTDSGALHIYSISNEGKDLSEQPVQTHSPHGAEHINCIVPIPPSKESTSGYSKQFVTTGGSAISVFDIRKGVLSKSEDQEIELIAATMVEGLKSGGTSVGTKLLVGQADGVVSLFERGVWDDQDERVVIDRSGASIDALCEVPTDFLPRMGKLKMNEKVVAAGLDDGRIRFLRIGRNAVIHEWDIKHDDMEGVISIIFDHEENRMISAGGQTVKIWTKASDQLVANGLGKRTREEDSGSDEPDAVNGEDSEYESEDLPEASDQDQSSEEEKGKRKKRKRNKGKDKSGGKALNFTGKF